MSIATHIVADAQAMPVNAKFESMLPAPDQPLSPPVGLVEVSTLPNESTAAHIVELKHDTAVIEFIPSMSTGVLQLEELVPLGVVEVTM